MGKEKEKSNRQRGMVDGGSRDLGSKCREKEGEKGKTERKLWFNEKTVILGASRGDGLIFDLSDPSVRVTGLSSDGGLR